nr:triple gene block protein 3 [Cowpea mild mottle virus]
MFAGEFTNAVLVSLIVLSLVISLSFYSYLNSYCTLYLTGESFTISNCGINQDLIDLIKEQREILNCRSL